MRCESFVNRGAYSFSTTDVGTCCAIDAAGSVDNELGARIDIDMLGCAGAVGIQSRTFDNAGTIEVLVESSAGAVGIGRYESSGDPDPAIDSAGDWCNSGSLEINVSGEADAVAAFGGDSVMGVDWRSSRGFSFDNSGTLTVTATSDGPAQLGETNWPSWQYFDTVGVGLMPGGDASFDNSGTMNISALNGYTAGLYVGGSNDSDISLSNSGDLDITTTTLGGDNVRSVGVYAQIPEISGGDAQNLPLSLSDGSLSLSVSAAEGASDLEDDALWGLCLVQTFTGSSVPGSTDELQQIDASGTALSGEPIVIKVDNDGKGSVAFINTVGTVDVEGNVIPSTEVSALPVLTGTVIIAGNLTVGSELTAELSGLPDGVGVSYHWQRETLGGAFVDIEGASGQTYMLTGNDAGVRIRVVVTPQGGEYGGELVATTEGAVSRPFVPPVEPTYPPEVDDPDNGSVTVTPSRPHAGDEVTVTPEPDEGFEVGGVAVTDKDGEPVEVTDNGDGTWTFVQPAGSVTVAVTFACDGGKLCPTAGFADVDQSQWYHDAVDWAVTTGAMTGYGDGSGLFGPAAPLTRAEMATVLWRLAGEPEAASELPPDCDASEWYATPVSWALETGAFSGYGDGTFGPANPLTREQAATVLWRLAGSPEVEADLSGYTDAGDVSGWALDAVRWAVTEGVLRGQGDGDRMGPQGTCSRAELCALMMRMSMR